MIYNKKIGIDFDDTLVDFVGGLILYHNQYHGTNLKKEDFTDSSLSILKRFTGNRQQRLQSFFESDYFRKLKPIEDAIEIMNLLKQQENPLYILTSRPDFLKKETEELAENLFPRCFSDIFYSYNHYSKRKNCGKTKAEICIDEGIFLMIDDSIDYTKECKEKDVNAFLFGDYSWNQNRHFNIQRTKNWRKFYNEDSRIFCTT